MENLLELTATENDSLNTIIHELENSINEEEKHEISSEYIAAHTRTIEFQTVIEMIRELALYRSIGSINEFLYRSMGSINEFNEAINNNSSYVKPEFIINFNDTTTQYKCPVCGNKFTVVHDSGILKGIDVHYCKYCGSKFKWR